jgi:deoxycytidylate deaminase
MVEKQLDNIKMSKKHKYFCRIASDLAKKSDVEKSKHGSVIVDGKKNILGLGYNKICKKNSCHSTHAEIAAILDAMKKHGKKSLMDSILYVVRIPNNDVLQELNYKPSYTKHHKKDYNYIKYGNTSTRKTTPTIKTKTMTTTTTTTTTTTIKTITKTITKTKTRQDSPKTRQDSRDTRQDSRDTRQDSPKTRQDSRDTRQDSRDTRQDSIDTRQDSIDTRQDSIDTRQDSPKTRQDSPKTRHNNICHTYNKTNRMIMSKPCEHCTKFIIENKIKLVYYSID